MSKEDTTQEIENLAELQFTTQEIELIAGVKIVGNKDHENAFLKGRLKAQAIVRRQILTMAGNGSTPAAKQFMDLVEQSDAEEQWES